jgi:stage III sporulation protein AA
VLSDGRIVCVRDISSVCIRIPHRVPGAAEPLYEAVREGRSVLVYSSPGAGKTTVLRELVSYISEDVLKRCAVIDTRYELSAMTAGGLCDVFLGYPRYEGIISAVRTMSPEYVICDEISDGSDVAALRYARASGVAVLASAHADSEKSLFRNESIAALLSDGVFDLVCGIVRRGELIIRSLEGSRG